MISQLHLFNPGHETALLEDSVHYTPKANIKRMGIDLAALPLWYGESQDFVLVSDEQYNQIIALKESLPIQLPQPVSPNHFPKVLDKQTGKPAPWGMTKGALHQLQCFCELSGYHLQTPNWNPAWKTLTSRTTAAACLNYLQEHFSALKLPSVPQFCQSIKELDDFVEKHEPPFIIKSPYSSSGRGLLWIREEFIGSKEKEWITGALRKQGSLSIEFGLNKQQDFALEYFITTEGKALYEGLSLFDVEKNGVYSGNRLDTQERLETDLKEQFGEKLIHLLKEAVGKTLEAVIGKAYSGYIGVDMITYQTPSGEYLIHPCIELNLRYTMGMLAIRLSERLIHKDSVGKFIVVFEKKKGKALELHVNDNKDNPLIWEADKIQEGYLSLCPVDEQTQYRAYIQISRINPEKEIHGTIKKDSEHK